MNCRDEFREKSCVSYMYICIYIYSLCQHFGVKIIYCCFSTCLNEISVKLTLYTLYLVVSVFEFFVKQHKYFMRYNSRSNRIEILSKSYVHKQNDCLKAAIQEAMESWLCENFMYTTKIQILRVAIEEKIKSFLAKSTRMLDINVKYNVKCKFEIQIWKVNDTLCISIDIFRQI